MTEEVPKPFRLHLGGNEVKAGWKILNIQPGPGVDYVGDIQDLSRFAESCCDELYASHVLEHVPGPQVVRTLQGFRRILKQGARAMISVPDLEVLCRQFLRDDLDHEAKFHVMRMMFGGQLDPNDFHFVGFSFRILSDALSTAGFTRVERVEGFGLFTDYSSYSAHGELVSVNVIAYK